MFKRYTKLLFSIILISLIIYSVKGYEIKLLSDENIVSTGYVNNSFELVDNTTNLIIGKVDHVINKGYIDFNVSSIPDNSIIHNVSLIVYVDYSSLSTNRVKINSMEKPSFLWDNTSNIFYDVNNGTTYNNSFKDFNEVGNKTIFLNDKAVIGLKSSLLSDVFSIGLSTKKDIANKYFRLNSSRADFGKPVLSVVYTFVNNTTNETDDVSNEINDTIDEDIDNTENESMDDTIENETTEDFENETIEDVNDTIENSTENDVSNETNSSVDVPVTNSATGGGGGGSNRYKSSSTSITERKELVTGLIVLELSDINVSINNEIVTKITLFPRKNLENFDFNVNKLSGKPEELPDLGIDVYSYISLEKKGFIDEDLEKAEIFFRVRNDWLNNYKKETLRLYRYNGVRWDGLETSEASSDEEFVYYKAISKGFSVFAIGAEKVKSETEFVKESGNYKISKKGVLSLIGLILLITFFVIFLKRKRKKFIRKNFGKKKNKLNFVIFPVLVLLFLFVVIQRKRETYFFDKIFNFFKQFFGFSGNTEVITTGFYNLNDVGGFLFSEFMLLFFVLIVIIIYLIYSKNK